MKAIAIIALVFASLSIFIPVGGVIIAIICSVLAMISFRSQPTLAGITFGINIINTAFLSPSILAADMSSSSGVTAETSKQLGIATEAAPTESGTVYFTYLSIHLVLLIIAVIWRLMRGAPKLKVSSESE